LINFKAGAFHKILILLYCIPYTLEFYFTSYLLLKVASRNCQSRIRFWIFFLGRSPSSAPWVFM